VTIRDDDRREGDETVSLELSDPAGATLGARAAAVLTIQDVEPAAEAPRLQFGAAAYEVREGEGGATVTVTRGGDASQAVTVRYATADGSATAGADYTAAAGTLTFEPGQASASFTVAVGDDGVAEGGETLQLTLSEPAGGAALGGLSTAVVTIIDNDGSTPPAPLTGNLTGAVRVSVVATRRLGRSRFRQRLVLLNAGGAPVADSLWLVLGGLRRGSRLVARSGVAGAPNNPYVRVPLPDGLPPGSAVAVELVFRGAVRPRYRPAVFSGVPPG
jgi:hypothetical protein